MSLVTIASRVSGFVRIAVFANVFGAALLGNTYQLANTVPNILFELFAAGALQAVLVPAMVRVMPVTRGVEADTGEAERVAGTVLTVLCGVLAVIAALAMVLAPQIMAVLASGERRADVREAEIELGVALLWFFMPQLVFYGANVVATAVLNARGWFAVPVFAPLLNNLVVIVVYLWFGARHDGAFSLDLSTADLWLLGGGTTLGVIVFCSLPVVAAWRSGFRLRPHREFAHPAVRRLASDGAWAGAFLAVSQVTQLVILRLLNREPGGPSAYQYAFVLFTLPHALFAVPTMTTRFPGLARAAQQGAWDDYRSTAAEAVRSITFMGLFAAAGTVAIATPALRVVTLGQGVELAPQISAATIAFAPGIVGYGLFLFLTRAMYALGDQRTPALVNAGIVAVSTGVMAFGVAQSDGTSLIAGLALVFGLAHVGGAVVLGSLVVRRLRHDVTASGTSAGGFGLAVSASRALGAAVVAGAAGVGVAAVVGWSTRGAAAIATVAAGLVVIVVYLGVQRLSGGPEPRAALRTMGGAR